MKTGNWGDYSDDEEDYTEKNRFSVKPTQNDVECAHPGCGKVLMGINASHFESRLMTFVADTTVDPSNIMCFCPSSKEAKERWQVIEEQMRKAQASANPSKALNYERRIERLGYLVEQFSKKKSCYETLHALQVVIANKSEFSAKDVEEYGESMLRDFQILYQRGKEEQEKLIARESFRRRQLA